MPARRHFSAFVLQSNTRGEIYLILTPIELTFWRIPPLMENAFFWSSCIPTWHFRLFVRVRLTEFFSSFSQSPSHPHKQQPAPDQKPVIVSRKHKSHIPTISVQESEEEENASARHARVSSSAGTNTTH